MKDPFGELGVDISPSELRETAYEIFVGACRSSGSGRRLTYVSNSSRAQQQLSMQRPVSSKVKKALGLKSNRKKTDDQGLAVGQLMRLQMRVSEQTDSRVRRSFLRVAAAQLGKRIELMVLPLELLQHIRSSDFNSEREYATFQKRNLKILEAGLLFHPHLPLDNSQIAPQLLRQILQAASEKPLEMGKHSESMHTLHNVVTSLASRSFDGSISDICHWADGVPLNLHLYRILLESCFDVNDEASVIEEIDEVLEQIKKTWVILGIDQVFHNLCFLWVLFNQYLATGETEDDLLCAADHMMLELVNDANINRDPEYLKILTSMVKLILDWAEKMLHRYHDVFYRVNIDVMQIVLSLGVSAARILVDISHGDGEKRKEVDVAWSRVDEYIRLSVRNAFSQEREKLVSSRKSSKNQQGPLPLLCILAQNTSDLAFNEKEIYSPILKRWHPHAASIAVATLHACFGRELKRFINGINELNPEAIQVLLAAEKLEKDLVEMAVVDSLDSEDGGKATIQEMTPYEGQAVINNLVKSWIQTRLEGLGEWVNRTLQQEDFKSILLGVNQTGGLRNIFITASASFLQDWNPQVNKGRFAPSAVEVVRIIDETLEAFFLLPIPMHPALLPELMGGLDKCVHNYTIKAISGCGSRDTYIPSLPPLTRCSTGSKFRAFKRKDRSLMSPNWKSHVSGRNGDDSFSVPQQCLRINTLYNIRKELEALDRRTISNLRNIGFGNDENAPSGSFGLSTTSCIEGIRKLSEATAYKVVFHDLSYVLMDHLYTGEISSSRIEPFLEELEQNLEVISVTVHDRVRTRVIIDLMKASFEGYLLVLLAGGPSRAFNVQDGKIIEEDLKFLTELFWSNGDGLPADVIDKLSATVKGVVSLFQMGSESLIEQFKHITPDINSKSRLALPPTTAQWSPTDPDTVLRVLCNRNDKMASNFLKKTFDLPKRT